MRFRIAFVLACLAGAHGLLGQSATRKPAPAAPAKPRGEVRVPFRTGELLTYTFPIPLCPPAGLRCLQAKQPLLHSSPITSSPKRDLPLCVELYTLY